MVGQKKLHFTPFHTSRQLKRDEALFPPVHNKVTMYARLAVIFCTFECSYSSVLRPILMKLHILTRLIESFPKVYRLLRCIEVKLSIPPGADAYRPSKISFERGNFLVLRLVLLKIAYFNSDNGQLFNNVLPKDLRQRKIADPSRSHCVKTIDKKSFDHRHVLSFVFSC